MAKYKQMVNLAKLRRKNDLTQRELAEKCGLQWETVSQYERGVRSPSIANLTKLADALDCKIDDIIEK